MKKDDLSKEDLAAAAHFVRIFNIVNKQQFSIQEQLRGNPRDMFVAMIILESIAKINIEAIKGVESCVGEHEAAIREIVKKSLGEAAHIRVEHEHFDDFTAEIKEQWRKSNQ